jgi:hypothetical protein
MKGGSKSPVLNPREKPRKERQGYEVTALSLRNSAIETSQ